MDFDKQRRQRRFKNKSKLDTYKHSYEANKEKIKSKEYRPKYYYDPNWSEEEEDEVDSSYFEE